MCDCIKITYVDLNNTEVTLEVNKLSNQFSFTVGATPIVILIQGVVWALKANNVQIGEISTANCPLGQFDLIQNGLFLSFIVEECDENPRTVTFSNTSQGWNSFWSFDPDWMTELNNVFYTMKDGDLWRHNTNSTRNNFYGVQYSSRIKTIFNASPLDNKVFKNLSINSNDAWAASIETNLQTADTPYTYFIEKEGFWFAYIRRQDNTISVKSLSTQGVGEVLSVYLPVPSVAVITFQTNIDKSSISAGDKLYKNSSGSLFFLGDIVSYNENTISINITFGSSPSPGDFLIAVKNSQVESYGVRGAYMSVDLENDSTDEVELFSLSSTAFKSFQ